MSREKLAPYRNDIIRHYSNGTSAAALGRQYGVTTTTITRLLKNAGVMPVLARGEHGRRRDHQAIISAFRGGARPSEIIREFNVSKSGLYAILNRSGVDLRGHVPGPMTEAERIRLAEGREASGTCNESEQAFRDFLTEAGIESRPQVALGTGVVDFVLPDHA